MKPYTKKEAIDILVWFQNEFVTTRDAKKRSYQLWALKEMITDICDSGLDPMDSMLKTRDRFLNAACINSGGKYMFAVAADICDSAIDLFT